MPRKARAIMDIRSEARKHTPAALKTLAGIMNQPDAAPAARIAAASYLVDRGWGKAPAVIEGEQTLRLVIERVERMILDPKDTKLIDVVANPTLTDSEASS